MRIFLFLICCFFCIDMSAQVFGAFPPSVKWKQIDTDTARIIFQSPVNPQAKRIAAIIHRMAALNPNSLGNNVRKINTVLHNNTTLANGYVALAPFRSEYYLIPSSEVFEMGANPWQEELAVHEYRHVQQNSNFNHGLSRAASFIFGEGGQALFNALAVPDWFYEGDAVHAESALTPQGRGRLPNFFNGYNALFREGRNYSWMKLRNGSLKDYVPSHYQLGYMLVNYGYEKYGSDFWKNVTQHAAAFKSLIYPLQGGIKKYAGVDFKTFRKQAIEYYSHEVSRKRTDSVRRSAVTNYYFPQFVGDDSIIYLKTSYNQLPAFYIRDSRGEHKIRLRNISSENWFSYRNNTVTYTAYDVNARWNLQDYSNIYLLNIQSGTEEKITAKGKYFTPDISPDGARIISVFVNDATETELHLLNKKGEPVKRITAQNGAFFIHPRFIDSNRIVVAERLPNSTMKLVLLNLQTEKSEQLVAPTNAVIGYPFVQGEKVYFVSTVSGNDDLFSLHLSDKKIYQHTSGVTGNYYPAVSNNEMVWSKFTSNGLQLMRQSLSSMMTVEVNPGQWNRVPLPFTVAGADTLPNVLKSPPRDFAVQDYKQGKHLFNFHSWRPDYTDPEINLSLFSDNILSTFSNEVFYRYNINESSHAVGFNSFYGGFFPVLNAGITYTNNRTIKTPARTLELDELEARAGYYIPLNFTQRKTYKALVFGSNIVHNSLTPVGIYKDSLRSSASNYLHHFIGWRQRLPRAVQHIYPKFGYAVSLAHRHLLGDNGFQFLGGSEMYLPSFRNHSIVLAASMQETDTANLVFSNRFSNSRGYADYFFSRMWKVSGNYHMPLFYPDWGFGNLVYFLRMRGNVFYDFSRVYSKTKINSRDLRSVGAEIYFDSKWWNQLPVTFGFRLSHLLDDDFSGNKAGKNVFEFIIPLDLIPD